MRSSLPVLTVVGIVCLGSFSAIAQQTSSALALSSTSQTKAPASPAVQLLKTRCLDTGLLRLGSTCTFQVVEPVTVGDRTFAVGDQIHAHVEEVKGVAGRVFLRTDRVVSAKTQQTTALSMVAVEQPRQPGVNIPHLLDGWKLSWEQH